MDSQSNSSPEGLGKTLICIEYPGVVNNVEKMIQTLGGIRSISTAYSEKNRRLELRFRPDDVYSKPACGDKHQTSAILLRVKVKRKELSTGDKEEKSVCKTSIVGKIDSVFRFGNLCDFQYLPMYAPPNDPMKMESIYETLVPQGMAPLSWIYQPALYFIPPAAFSRMDSVQGYMYRKDAPGTEGAVPHNIIGRTRRRRSIHAIFITFDIREVPKKPREMAVQLLRVKFLEENHLGTVRKLFENRPVWSKNALMCITKYTSDQLKYLLPAVAYYFVTGPWRVMWIRFGYDPRKEPASRIYQTLDYRLRKKGGMKTKVKAKRSYTNYLLPYKLTPASQPKVAVISKEMLSTDSPPSSTKAKEDPALFQECNYLFRPGMVPPSRQMFYQYCDAHVPEIQEMLDKLPLPLPGAECHERDGWLPSGFADQCREIINNLIMETLRTDASYASDNRMLAEASTSKKRELSDSSESDAQEEEDDDEDEDEDDEIAGEVEGEVVGEVEGEWEVDLEEFQ